MYLFNRAGECVQGGKSKWVVDTSKGSSSYVPGAFAPGGAGGGGGGGGGVGGGGVGGAGLGSASKRMSGTFDPAQ